MKIDDFKPTTVYTIYIASTPERVWEALTTGELSRQYFSGNAVEVDLKVGGAFIVDLVEHSTGINLWREWAKIEVAHLRNETYTIPVAREDYAGSVLCLAQTAEPDTESGLPSF